MRLRDELVDPWGLLFGGLAAGFATAVAIPMLPAVAIGAGVYATKVVTGLFADRPPKGHAARVLPVNSGSPEESWVRRAEHAERAFRDVADSVGPGPVSEQVRGFGDEIRSAVATMRRLAGQASAVTNAVSRIDVKRVVAERDRIRAVLAQPGYGRVRQEQERTVAALQAQLDAYSRLTEAHSLLLARLESGTIALEGLVARLAEVVALTETSAVSAGGLAEVEELAAELEGLRAGLVEAEDASERTLGELETPDPGTVGRREPRRAR